MQFVKESRFAVPAAQLWAFHERPDAFALLSPPWQRTEIIQAPTSLAIGTVVRLKVKMPGLPLWQTIEAEHTEYERGHFFVDKMNRGPFATWVHRHIIEADGPNASKLIDQVDYELPFGSLGKLFGAGVARRQLEKLFTFRHEVTRREVNLAAQR